jgi:hypothetical protein
MSNPGGGAGVMKGAVILSSSLVILSEAKNLQFVRSG